MRVFIDTNILISAYYFDGNERKVLKAAIEGKIEGVINNFVFQELQRVMRKKFHEENDQINIYIVKLRKTLQVTEDIDYDIVRDRNDATILGSALHANCHRLVTGDKDLLVLNRVNDLKIVKSRNLLEKIVQNSHENCGKRHRTGRNDNDRTII